MQDSDGNVWYENPQGVLEPIEEVIAEIEAGEYAWIAGEQSVSAYQAGQCSGNPLTIPEKLGISVAIALLGFVLIQVFYYINIFHLPRWTEEVEVIKQQKKHD